MPRQVGKKYRKGQGRSSTSLAGRLQSASKGMPVRQVASITGFNHETVRRYLRDGGASPDFLHSFCTNFGVTADWLLGVPKKLRASAAVKAARK
jgi:hypothetical protein